MIALRGCTRLRYSPSLFLRSQPLISNSRSFSSLDSVLEKLSKQSKKVGHKPENKSRVNQSSLKNLLSALSDAKPSTETTSDSSLASVLSQIKKEPENAESPAQSSYSPVSKKERFSFLDRAADSEEPHPLAEQLEDEEQEFDEFRFEDLSTVQQEKAIVKLFAYFRSLYKDQMEPVDISDIPTGEELIANPDWEPPTVDVDEGVLKQLKGMSKSVSFQERLGDKVMKQIEKVLEEVNMQHEDYLPPDLYTNEELDLMDAEDESMMDWAGLDHLEATTAMRQRIVRSEKLMGEFLEEFEGSLQGMAAKRKAKREKLTLMFREKMDKVRAERRKKGLPEKPPPKYTMEENLRVSLNGKEFLEDCEISKDHPYYEVLEEIALAVTLNPSWEYHQKRQFILKAKHRLEWAEKEIKEVPIPEPEPRKPKYLYFP